MTEDNAYQFWGGFEHAVDDKGRVIIPQEFREALGEEFVVTRGPDKAILVLPMPLWQQIQNKLKSAVFQQQAHLLQRLLGLRSIVRLDPQSRLAIPKLLRDWAGITQSETAVIVGEGSKLEIFSKKSWDLYSDAQFNYSTLYDAAEAIGLAEVVERNA
jgi:MraZ protein